MALVIATVRVQSLACELLHAMVMANKKCDHFDELLV